MDSTRDDATRAWLDEVINERNILRATVRAALEASNDLESFYKARCHDDAEHDRVMAALTAAENALWALFPDLERVNP
jgi:hypothetical protein